MNRALTPYSTCSRGAVALALIVATATAPAQAAADRLVAVVNDELITASEVDAARAVAPLDLLDEILPGLDRRKPDADFAAALDALIDQRLLLQEARAVGVAATDDEAKAALQALAQERRLDGLDGVPPDAILRRVQDQLTIVKLVNREVRSRLLINAADVVLYYQAHPERFTRAARYRLRQIFVKSPAGGDESERAAARAEAEAIRAEAMNGADFSALARRRSQGSEAVHGGDLGLLRRGELLPEIDAVLGGMHVGEVSPVIATPIGFHIVNVVEIQPDGVRPLEEVKTEVEELVYREQAAEFYRRWLRQLRSRAHIDIKL